MKRKQLKSLVTWLNATDRKPLVIRGARQIGKSTLVRLFAEQIQRPLAEVNLERYPDAIKTDILVDISLLSAIRDHRLPRLREDLRIIEPQTVFQHTGTE